MNGTAKPVEVEPEVLLQRKPNTLMVQVRSITYQGDDINAYELVPVERGGDLPPFDPGSHIDLFFRDGRIRQYSLCGDPRDTSRYHIAVQREQGGRGGSKAIFEKVHVGRKLVISQPRNNFPLADNANHHILLAGGIGVTPMMAMARELLSEAASFELHYCARTANRVAFLEEIESGLFRDKITLYIDGGDPQKGVDLHQLLSEPRPDTHVYVCGPSGFINAVVEAASAWPKGSVHKELFAVPTADPDFSASEGDDDAIPVGFQIELRSTGARLDVPPDKSIVEVLAEHGVEVDTSCEAGVCGTCLTRVISGTPDHRDYVLSDDEKEHSMLVCCSRSKSPLLVLDL
ncbi:MAG: oxidoreductase [Hyphomicrobiales bacterium]|nr:oxidoreductase [Hyphomicrobiales bacterium]